MTRLFLIASWVGCCLAPVLAQEPSKPSTGPAKTEATQHYTSSHIRDLQWSESRSKEGNTETVTRVLQGVSEAQPFLIEQEKTTKISDKDTRVTKTSFSVDSNGKRNPTQIVQEEHRATQGAGESVTRTVSLPDLAGRFSVVRQETETRTSPAPGQWTTSTAVLLPNINGGFRQVESLEKVEREKSPGVKEITSTSSTLYDNGTRSPFERRQILIEERKDSSKSEHEEIYRPNANGQLVLAEREQRSYRKEAGGREHWTTETYGGKNSGLYPGAQLALDRNVDVVRETGPDGSVRTVEKVAERNAMDRSKGMELVEETVTTAKPVGGGVTEVLMEVRQADGNGNMKTSRTRKMRLSDR